MNKSPSNMSTDPSSKRLLILLEDEALAARIKSTLNGATGGADIVTSLRECAAKNLDEYDAFIVGETLPDAAPTDAVTLIREHADDAPILVALGGDHDDIAQSMLERGADECVDLTAEYAPHILAAALAKHIELCRVKRENLRLQAALARSLAELKRKNRELEEQAQRLETIASTDLLTNLANRWRLQERINPMFAESQRYNDDLACLMIDLDDFKVINDTLGHQTGDDLLTSVGRIVNEQVRASDIAARIGGDEFVIVLPRTPATTAAALAERIANQFRRHAREFVGEEHACGMSIGIASLHLSKPLDAKQLLSHADNALYAAKRSGTHSIMICAADGVTAQPFNTVQR